MSEVGAPGAGAPAPATETSVPLPDRGVSPPNPATSSPAAKDGEVSQGQPPSGKERRSISDSLDKAFEAAKTEPKAEAKAKPEPKPEPRARPETKAEPAAKPEPAKASPRERGDDGRFAPSQPQEEPAAASQSGALDHSQPPHRFSPEAKAEWANAPETVKTEAHRAIRELEGGLHKYRQDAEAYHEVRQFDELAKATGTTLPKALANYVTIERQLASDDPNEKWDGIQRVLKRAQIDPRQLASAILGQPLPAQEQQQSELNQRLQAYERKIAALEQTQVQQIQKQQYREINGSVKAFASERPRFDELSLEIASYLNGQNDRGIHIDPQRRMPAEQRLQQAYELAESLNPSAGRSASLSPEPRPANTAGTRSIAGSPANGSDPTLPAKKGRHPTREESLDRAFAKLS